MSASTSPPAAQPPGAESWRSGEQTDANAGGRRPSPIFAMIDRKTRRSRNPMSRAELGCQVAWESV